MAGFTHATLRALALSVIGICAFALTACGKEEPTQTTVRPVIVAAIESADTQTNAFQFAGRVDNIRQAPLAFEVAGRIKTIHADEGQPIRQGQVLAELDPTDFKLAVRDAQAQLRHVSQELARTRMLRDEGILADAAVDPLQAQTESARVALANAQRQLTHTRLVAPFDGVVSRRLEQVNTIVQAGQPVIATFDDAHVDVQVDLPEHAAIRLPLNASLSATGEVLASRGATLPLRYLEHATQPEPTSRTYRLVLRAPKQADMTLLPGMAVRVTLNSTRTPADTSEVSKVPASALQTDEHQNSFVWLLKPDSRVAERVPVAVLAVADDHALIEGLADLNARVVVAGARALHADQEVEPIERK